VAVCLLPGTELAFDEDVRYERAFSLFGNACVNHKVARFRQIDMNDPHVQHDALEFPNGQVLKIAQLVAGQTATVLQLPVATQHHEHVETARIARADSRRALNRGTTSILMPNQGAVMLWQTVRSTAVELSIALEQSFRRLTAHEQHVDPEEIEESFEKGPLTVTLPKQPPAQKSEKKIEAKAAA